jgi:hypothetical protein
MGFVSNTEGHNSHGSLTKQGTINKRLAIPLGVAYCNLLKHSEILR